MQPSRSLGKAVSLQDLASLHIEAYKLSRLHVTLKARRNHHKGVIFTIGPLPHQPCANVTLMLLHKRQPLSPQYSYLNTQAENRNHQPDTPIAALKQGTVGLKEATPLHPPHHVQVCIAIV
jgi:hypothetical protein